MLQLNDTMETTILIQSINDSLGEIRIFQGQTVSRIEDIAKDISEMVQQHNSLCTRVDDLEEYVLSKKAEARTTIVLVGALSGLIGAAGGALGIIFMLFQLGSMMGGNTP